MFKKQKGFDPTSVGMKWVDGVKILPLVEKMINEFYEDCPGHKHCLTGILIDPIGFYHLEREVKDKARVRFDSELASWEVLGIPIRLNSIGEKGVSLCFSPEIAPLFLKDQIEQLRREDERRMAIMSQVQAALENGTAVMVNVPPPVEEKKTVH